MNAKDDCKIDFHRGSIPQFGQQAVDTDVVVSDPLAADVRRLHSQANPVTSAEALLDRIRDTWFTHHPQLQLQQEEGQYILKAIGPHKDSRMKLLCAGSDRAISNPVLCRAVQGRQRRLLMRVHMQAPLARDPTNLWLANAVLFPAMANRAVSYEQAAHIS
ncbi:hypothetical protein WJX77_012478 [Trebouxia sp. C0004]